MVLTALACPVFTSCYNDAALWDEIEGIHGDVATLEQKLAALEAKLNTDLQALKTLLEGQISKLEGKVDALVTVKDVKENTDGSVTVTLSDNTEFTVHPKFEQDYTGLVTTTTIDGVLYWAVFDENGNAVAVTDADGDLVPVVDVVPQVRINPETALVEISFDGGTTWQEVGYNEPCVFEGAEVVWSDNYTDEQEAMNPDYYAETPLYVVLTLPDGNTITVTLDGAASFIFGSAYGGPVTTQYVGYGKTATVQAQVSNVTDWLKEVPAGWTVTESTANIEYGIVEFDVVAPTAEAIASGTAFAEGDLRVVAVAEGGKTIASSVKLTTKAFNQLAAANGALTVGMNNGLGGYLVGISTVEDFDAEAIVAELKAEVEKVVLEEDWWTGELVESYPWSPWYPQDTATTLDDNYMDMSIEEYPLEELVSSVEMEEGGQYIVWAVGLNSWYDNATYQSGYTVGSIVSTTYYNSFIILDETKTKAAFNGIEITVEFKGVTQFYGYFANAQYGAPNDSELVSEVNMNLQYGAWPIEVSNYADENGVYVGDPVTLVEGWQSIEPGCKYYMWLAPAYEGKTSYTRPEIYYYEFTTPALTAGGTATLTAGEATLDYNKISVPLTASAEDAAYIYYAFVEPSMLSTIADKQEYLLGSTGNRAVGSTATVYKANISTNTTYTLLAMAVDANGSYGEVFQNDYTTKSLEYASAVVTPVVQGTPSTTGTVMISCDAEVAEYLYWYGTKDNYIWTSYFGGSAEGASEYFALNPNFYYINHVTPDAIPDNCIEMTNLTYGAVHLFAVSAKLTDGTYTKVAVVEFTPSMTFGTFVYATDDNGAENPVWTAAKPVVTPNIESVGDFSQVSWTVSVPEGFTAKTACFSEEYLTDYPTAKDKVQFILSYEYIDLYDVVEGESYTQPYASKGYNIYTVVCDAEGNYYETYVTNLDITGGFGV